VHGGIKVRVVTALETLGYHAGGSPRTLRRLADVDGRVRPGELNVVFATEERLDGTAET
jgi:hypothetical protein